MFTSTAGGRDLLISCSWSRLVWYSDPGLILVLALASEEDDDGLKPNMFPKPSQVCGALCDSAPAVGAWLFVLRVFSLL